MLLLIDNYDSFSYNLAQYFEALGQQIVIFRNDELDAGRVSMLEPSHIIISPGPGTPEDAGCSLDIIAAFFDKIPILGICLGHQCLAHFSGARIVQAKTIMHGKTSPIFHCQSGLFQTIPQAYLSTRYHSLAIEPSSLDTSWEISAWSQDKSLHFEDIMAITHRRHPLFGVQFHPEAILSEHGHQLLSNFLDITQ